MLEQRVSVKRNADVEIRRYDDGPDCDVVVTVGGRRLVVSCPTFEAAQRWARIECRSYGLPEPFGSLAFTGRSDLASSQVLHS